MDVCSSCAPEASLSEADRLVDELRSMVHALRTRLAKLERSTGGDGIRPSADLNSEIDAGELLAMCRGRYSERRHRASFISRDHLGEPSWDILLDLFQAHLSRRSLSVSAACLGADVPPTTALRHINCLERAGLLTSRAHGRDGRVRHVELSPQGVAQMTDYFTSLQSGARDPRHFV